MIFIFSFSNNDVNHSFENLDTKFNHHNSKAKNQYYQIKNTRII